MSRENIEKYLKDLQNSICSALETEDGGAVFREDVWKRDQGGGGITRIISKGNVIEKGGVLFSAVHGDAPEFLLKEKEHALYFAGKPKPQFYATGVSIVIHPQSPMVPIIHMNVRYFEMDGGVSWFGGGIDLTPHYIEAADAGYFHGELKKVCDRHDVKYYDRFRKWADDYFFIKHRNETRGIGGIFFDRLTGGEGKEMNAIAAFWKDVGNAFAPLYVELIKRNRNRPWGEREKNWQLLRRGRYVEFNLVYDKGTKFGLESNGRVESILMSLPQTAGWEYDHRPEAGSKEEDTVGSLRKGINWLG